MPVDVIGGQPALSLREKRVLFTRLLSSLVLWVTEHAGWELAFGEGLVKFTDAADGDYDGPHKKDGAHYTGLGLDRFQRVVIGPASVTAFAFSDDGIVMVKCNDNGALDELRPSPHPHTEPEPVDA